MFGDLDKNTKQFPVKKLNEISSYWNGLTYKPADTVEAGNGTLVLRSSNIQEGDLAFDDNVFVSCAIKEKLLVQDNDILMCSRNGSAALVGKTALIKDLTEPTTFGAFMMIIRSDYYSYLKTYFESAFFRNQISTGTSTINQITGKMLNEISLPVPDMDTVRTFEVFTHQSDKSKFYGKSQFIEMFGDIEKNCKGYPVKQIGEFSNLFAGATPSTKVSAYWENGTIPWMSSGEVHMGRVASTEKKISQLGYDKCSTKMVPLHTVVIALAGQGKTRGTVAVTEIELCTNQSLCAIVTDGTVLSDYLYHNLRNRYEEIRNMCAITDGRGGLTLKIVGSIKVIVPSIEEQKQFVAFAEQSDKSKLSSIS